MYTYLFDPTEMSPLWPDWDLETHDLPRAMLSGFYLAPNRDFGHGNRPRYSVPKQVKQVKEWIPTIDSGQCKRNYETFCQSKDYRIRDSYVDEVLSTLQAFYEQAAEENQMTFHYFA